MELWKDLLLLDVDLSLSEFHDFAFDVTPTTQQGVFLWQGIFFTHPVRMEKLAKAVLQLHFVRHEISQSLVFTVELLQISFDEAHDNSSLFQRFRLFASS